MGAAIVTLLLLASMDGGFLLLTGLTQRTEGWLFNEQPIPSLSRPLGSDPHTHAAP